MAQPLRIAQVDRDFGAGELGEALAAAAAGRAQALARGDHQRFRDLALAGCNHRCDRARLRAVALRIAGVLDVGAGEDAPGCGAHRRAHSKVRVRGMRVAERRASRLEQVLHAHLHRQCSAHRAPRPAALIGVAGDCAGIAREGTATGCRGRVCQADGGFLAQQRPATPLGE